jgi:Mg-chelatase subunit ChlD
MRLRSLLATALLAASAPSLAGERAILVLDASGSMWQTVDGRTKVEIARDAVDAMLADWNPEVSLGLMAYGHRRRGDCNDIELLIPPEGFDRARISRTVRNLNALGMTPITASVRQAAEALRHTEHKATVILVSDGEETCNADPCALGAELAAQGIDFTAHVIGFDLPEGPARDQLQCLARETGGRYLEARDAAELNRALGAVVTAAPAAAPASGCVAYDDTGLAGERLALAPGTVLDDMTRTLDASGYNWNDRILSLECSPGCTVEAFEHIHFDGDRVDLGGRLENLPGPWGMTISSLRVACGTAGQGPAARTSAGAATPPAPEPAPERDPRDETLAFMPCIDLYESDYDSFDLAPGDNARTCQARCLVDDRCDAWTWTRPGWQAEHGKCWLKSGSPWQRNCDECTSGAKPGVKVFIDEGFVDPSGRPECRAPASVSAR